MKTSEYWERRRIQDKRRSLNASEHFIQRYMKGAFKRASKEIQEEVNRLYERVSKEEGISLHDARKRLSEKEFRSIDFEKMIQDSAGRNRALLSGELPEGMKEEFKKRQRLMEKSLREYSRKGYIDHLTLQNLWIRKTIHELTNQEQVSMYEFLTEQYQDGYFRSVFSVQEGIGFGKDFAAPPVEAVRKAVLQSWSKKNFSERIWGHEEQFATKLKKSIITGLIRGESVEQMRKRVQERMDVSASNVRRLVRTESAHIYEQSTLDAYEECGITEYQYLATLDRRTSKICQELDGKVFSVRDAKPGINYPPMHPNCRSTTVAYTEGAQGARAARGSNNRYYTVPDSMNYQTWLDSLSEDERGQMSILNRKDRNQKSDEAQYERYKVVLGETAGSFSHFRSLKYSDGAAFRKLEKRYKESSYAAAFQKKILTSEVSLTIQRTKQLEHTQGTPAWKNRLKQALVKGKTPQSFLYKNVDPEALAQKYAGHGVMKYTLHSGYYKEFVDVDVPVGRYYNNGRKYYVESDRICILYNNKGVHVFPVKKGGNHVQSTGT